VHWDDNTTHYEGSDKDLVYVVEDHYSLKTVYTSTKYREARQNMAQAMICSAGGNPNTLFLTFLSGEGDPFHTPAHYADYVNKHINDWIRRDAESGVRAGIVVMDYAGNSDHNGFEIIDTLIKQNKFVSNN